MPEDTEIAAALVAEIRRAQDSTSLRLNWQEALDTYLQRAKGDVTPGKSNVRSYDVADVVEAHVAEVMPALSGDAPAEFEPMGAGDEEQAELESMGVNKFLMENNPGFLILTSAVKEAALLKNAFIKVWVEVKERSATRTFKGVDDDEVAAILSANDLNTETVLVSRRGQNATVRRTVTERRFKIKTIPRENMSVSQDHDSPLIADASFVAERKLMSRSELIAAGLKRSVVEALTPHAADDFVQSRYIDGRQPDRIIGPKDRDLIEIFECYYEHDRNMNGQVELWRYLLHDNVILDSEPAQFIPYASGTGTVVPGRFDGLSIYDKVKETADQKTDNKRNWLENQAVANRSRLIVGEGTNLDDVMSDELMHPIRTRDAAQVQPLPFLDTSASNLALAQYLDKERSERAGAVMEMQAAEPQLLRSQLGSLGTELVMSAQEIRSANVVRTLAETLLRSLFLLVHTVMRQEWPEPIMLQFAGEWREVNASEWQPRTHLNVKSALSASQRNRQVQNLTSLLQIQAQLVAGGLDGILVDPSSIHNAVMDWAKAAEIDAPQKYLVDPMSEAGQRAAQVKQQAQQESQQLQIQLQTLSDQIDKYKVDQDNQTKLIQELIKADVEEAKLIAQTEVERLRAQSQTAGDQGADRGNGAA